MTALVWTAAILLVGGLGVVLSKCDQSKREREAADRYARAIGLHLSADEQARRFKERTKGAPVVRRGWR